MYIYNITTNISEKAHDKWLQWMQEEHIPAMLKTKKFTKATIVQVSVNEEMGGTTYSTMYYCASAEELKDFYREYAPKLNGEVLSLFRDQVVIFGTELKIIKEFTK
jgi:hypothetical protein